MTRIGDDALTRGNAAGLQLVVQWAQGQRDRLDALVGRIPSGPAHDQAQASATEIRTGLKRASDLLADYTDATCTRTRDDFGPTPCLVTPHAPAQGPAPSGPSSPGGTTGVVPGPTGGPATTTPAPATPAAPGPSKAPTAAGSTTAGPATSAASPVVVDSCGVQVNLPIATVSLGTCPPGR